MKFDLFRFQLLPASRSNQLELFKRTLDTSEIIQRKNEFLSTVINGIETFDDPKSELDTMVGFRSDEWLVLKIAPKRQVKRTVHFRTDYLDDWPDVLFVLNNDPEVQTIAVSSNAKAFANTSTVVNIFKKNIERKLLSMGLIIEIEARFNKKNFWDVIAQHGSGIKSITFDLVTPNMSNVSKMLTEDLKALSKGINAQRTKIELSADNGAVLEVSKEEPQINSLVDYAAKGGGNISIKATGVRRKIQTAKNIESIEMDELYIDGNAAESLNFIKGLFQ